MSILAAELEWPEGTKFFEVQCRLGIWDIDGWDADKAPEVKALGGTVRITPRTPTGRIRILEPDGKYRVVVATPLTFAIDEYTGKLVNTADNTEGVWVVDPTSETVDPNGFTYSAVVTPNVGSPFTVEFDGSVAINGVYDLANGATVVPSKGVSALDSRIAKLEQDVGSLDVTTTELGKEVGSLSGIATTLDYLLVGPGRPDTPATTGGIITGSEPVGCEYRSTDGAGVGAWVWTKRPTGWEVTDGDTGWRRVDSLVEKLFTLTAPHDRGIYIRRTGWRVTFAVSGSTATVEQTSQNLPAGFSPDTVRFQMSIHALRQPSVQVQLLADSAARLMLVPNTTPAGTRVSGYLEWSTANPWPTTLPGSPA